MISIYGENNAKFLINTLRGIPENERILCYDGIAINELQVYCDTVIKIKLDTIINIGRLKLTKRNNGIIKTINEIRQNMDVLSQYEHIVFSVNANIDLYFDWFVKFENEFGKNLIVTFK